MKNKTINTWRPRFIFFALKLECDDSINTFINKYYPLCKYLIDLHLSHIMILWPVGFPRKAHSVKDKLYGLYNYTQKEESIELCHRTKNTFSLYSIHKIVQNSVTWILIVEAVCRFFATKKKEVFHANNNNIHWCFDSV